MPCISDWGDSKWSDRKVRTFAAKYAIDAMVEREPIANWILDDTGFLKQGKHSVSVQRQYTGSAGKIANSRVGVSLSVATRTEHLPIDFELYLPKSWTENPARRTEARIPTEVEFKTKPELALQMINNAIAAEVPRGVLLGDEGYGNSGSFRAEVTRRGLQYAVAINSSTTVWVPDRKGGLWSVSPGASGSWRRNWWRSSFGRRPGEKGRAES